MGLKDIGESLPPGFRFYPSDEELVCHYLHKKIANEDILKGTLVEIDLHTCEPWQLPEVAKLNGSDWYFFSFRDRKYATGFRTNRATTCGYWKATGKDRVILDPNTQQIVGMRKTLVFYKNRAPNGMKTGWIMHEFRLESPHMPPKEDWVLCRVFEKNKGDDPHLFDTTNTSSYPSLTNGDQNMMNYKYQLSNSIGFNQPSQTLTCNYQNALDNSLTLLNPNCNNMLQLLKEGNSSGDVSSFNDLIMADLPKNDDDDGDQQYGLQWDMMGHGISHGYHHHHGLDGMGFEDDNGVVLL